MDVGRQDMGQANHAVLGSLSGIESLYPILHVELIEAHHDKKEDAPSGSALKVAADIAAARSHWPPAPESETVTGVRGGVADIMEALPRGRMLLAYSGCLHHIQVPGQHLPKLFKSIHLSTENLDIAEYRQRLNEDLQGQTRKHLMKEVMEGRKAMWALPF